MSIFLQLSAILRHHHHHHHYHHHHHHYHHHHLPLNREGRSGTTDHFATSFLHFFFLLFTVLWDLANSNPVYSLMLSSHLFLCLSCLLPPFTVPCKMVFARPGERNTWPYHCSLCLLTMVRRFSCGPIAYWILARTSSLVTWSLYGRSILRQQLISMDCILWSSAVRVPDLQACRKMDATRESISCIFELREILPSLKTSSIMSMLLLRVLSLRVSRAWNPHQL